MALLNLGSPIRSERRRQFQPPWYTVFIYLCKECGKETTVRAGSFRGKRAEPSTGAITCPHCEFIEKYGKEKSE
jgi:DNA-directed RNA polymerase subunit RPC12/RpoP